MQAEITALDNGVWLTRYDETLATDWTSRLLVFRNSEMSGPNSQRAGEPHEMIRTPLVEQLPYFEEILDALKCGQGRVRITRLGPDRIGRHRNIADEATNFALRKVRLHVPIITGDQCSFIIGNERLQLRLGRFYYANFSKPHHVANEGTTYRYHLVMDREVNDWLMQYFPQHSILDKLHMNAVRLALPMQRRYIFARARVLNWAWRLYEGSSIQRLKHSLLSKQA